MKKIATCFLTAVLAVNLYAQSSEALEKATANLRKAVELMDTGSPDLSIPLLEEAKKLDPTSFIYDYEMGYAYTIKKDYKLAAEAIKRAMKFKDANDQCYQMLGSIYDYQGNPGKALKTFDAGLKKFPNSGKLWLEKGNVFWIQKKFNEAIPYYEEGIKAEPMFPSNYYRLAFLFLNSEEEVWGMLYGELFLNLERNSKRTEEISLLLYNTCKSEITFSSDTAVNVSFSKSIPLDLSIKDLENLKTLKLPFGLMVYEPIMAQAVIGEKEISQESLARIRERFLKIYYEKQYNIEYPNPLFDFQQKVSANGLMNAYSRWIFGAGDPDNFTAWTETNEEEWSRFVDWFNQNQLDLNSENYFVRTKN